MQVDNPGNHRGSSNKFSSRRAFLEDAESLDPAPCGPEPDHCCRQPRHVPLGQGGLVDQLDDHRALSPGGRAGGGILHGDDGAGDGLVTTIHPGVVGQEKVGGSIGVTLLQTLIQLKTSSFHPF